MKNKSDKTQKYDMIYENIQIFLKKKVKFERK